MSSSPRQNPSPQAIPPTLRQLITQALLRACHDPACARFAMLRALERLDLDQLKQVFDEVSETFDGPVSGESSKK